MVDQLNSEEGGVWQVTTEASIYLLDLDHDLMFRAAGAADEPHLAPDGAFVVITHYPFDGRWLRLAEIVQCRVGESLILYHYDAAEDGPYRLRSTYIQHITQLSEPGHDTDPDTVPRPQPGRKNDRDVRARPGHLRSGSLDLTMFDQAEWWTDPTGRRRPISSLSAEQTQAAIADVREHAHTHRQRLRTIAQRDKGRHAVSPSVDPAVLARIEEPSWPERTPLMRALHNHLHPHGSDADDHS